MLKEYSQILIDIQKKSRITIHKISDVKNLKNEIQGVTNKNISFNTLRRLFGYLPRTTPSQATLKILANYLGYTSYSNYLFNKKNYDDWYFKMKMLRLQLSNKVLTKEQVSLFNFGLDNNDNIVSVGSYISFLIEQNNINSLKVFYKNFNYEKLSNSNISKLSIIITFGFYKLSDKKILEIYKELIVFDSFRYTGPLFFIDYSNLNGYYMKALKMIKTLNKSKSDYLFVSIMEFYQKFYANEKFNNIVVAPLEDDKKIFPVLKGRYYAYKILASDQVDAIIQKKILKELKLVNPYLFLVEIVPSLILKESYIFLSILMDKYYEQIFEMDRWSSQSTISNYLIGLANVNIYKGNLKTAKINLELIELDKVELGYTDFLTLFYYLTYIRLYAKENNKELIVKYHQKLTTLAESIGYLKFISVSEKYTRL